MLLLRAPRCVASGKLDEGARPSLWPYFAFRRTSHQSEKGREISPRNTKYARNPTTKVYHETGIPPPRVRTRPRHQKARKREFRGHEGQLLSDRENQPLKSRVLTPRRHTRARAEQGKRRIRSERLGLRVCQVERRERRRKTLLGVTIRASFQGEEAIF